MRVNFSTLYALFPFPDLLKGQRFFCVDWLGCCSTADVLRLICSFAVGIVCLMLV